MSAVQTAATAAAVAMIRTSFAIRFPFIPQVDSSSIRPQEAIRYPGVRIGSAAMPIARVVVAARAGRALIAQ
jgi:hypothetical protein